MEQILDVQVAPLTETRGAFAVNATGVSWPAVFGGTVAGAALSLILLSLGAGLGLSALSPWSGVGASGTAAGAGVIIWLFVVQIVAGSFGGYLAGRLRRTWPTLHNDEVYFRDTAHGFLSWGLAMVLSAAFLATAATVMVGSSKAASDPPANVAAEASSPNAYFVDMLLRTPTGVDTSGTVVRGEVARIFDRALADGNMPAPDRTYLASVISARTGLDAPSADRRVSDVFAEAQQAIDTARRATAHTLLWFFAALLSGAFFASVAATVGGRQRDNVIVV